MESESRAVDEPGCGYSTDDFIDLMADDRQWMDILAQECYEKSIEALWHALMAIPQEMFDHLRRECGVDLKDIECYRPYQPSNQLGLPLTNERN